MKPTYKIFKHIHTAKYKARIYSDKFSPEGAEGPEFDGYEEAEYHAKAWCNNLDESNWREVT